MLRSFLASLLIALLPPVAWAGAGSIGDSRNVSSGTITAYQGGIWTVDTSTQANLTLITGVYNATPPSLPPGTTSPFQQDINGRLLVNTSLTSTNFYSCAVDGGLNAATAGTDNPIWLLVNPSTSTKRVILVQRTGNTNVANVLMTFNLYIDPVITSSGTVSAVTKIYQSGVPNSQARCYTLPAVSAEGSIIDQIVSGQNTSSWITTDNLALDPGHVWMFTANPGSNNRAALMSFKWVEQ